MSPAIPQFVLIFAVSFNALLAIANGHGVTLQRGHVVVAEMAVYAAAFGTIFLNADRKMLPWFLLTVFIVLNGLVLGLGNGAFNPKYVRDVLAIPTFIMLGMTYRSQSLTRPIVILQTVVFAVAILEAVSPQAYSAIFQVLKYYVNTRDVATSAFWNTDSDLFVSATRPGDRFFGFVNLHRVSSIFLEPVSLGNYCVVIAIFLIAYWKELDIKTRLYLAVSTMALLVACDGRLALASILLVLFAAVFVRNIQSRWAVLNLPMILLASVLLVLNFNLDPRQDNFTGRIAGSMNTLSQVDFAGLVGLDASSSDAAADSGITYFVLSQSFIGVIVIWCAVCLVPEGRRYFTRLYVHGIAIFVPLNLLVSYSLFSIKTASLIWFCFGYFFMNDDPVDVESSTPSGAGLRTQIGRAAVAP
jgi:putative polymerase